MENHTGETTTSYQAYKSKKDKWIQQLARANYPLMPLYAGSKVPIPLQWPLIEPDASLTEANFPDGYGVPIPEWCLVIDVDPDKEGFFREDGTNSLSRLQADLGLPDVFNTFTVKTGSAPTNGMDHLHIYLKMPPGRNLKKKLPEYPGIDILSKGSYVVGPGSLHMETKKPYVVIMGEPDILADAPHSLLQAYQNAPRKLTAGLTQESNSEATQNRFKKYLATAPLAVQNSDGDTCTFKVAEKARDFGLPANVAYELMRDHWNDRCSPPWSPEGLAKKVQNAYDYARDVLGNDHPDNHFEANENAPDPLGGEWDFKDRQVGGKRVLDSTINNVVRFLTLEDGKSPIDKLFCKNKFTGNIELTRSPLWRADEKEFNPVLTDTDVVQLELYFSKEKQFNPSPTLIGRGIDAYASKHAYHPIQDYLKNLKWDGKKRADMLFTTHAGAAESDYVKAVSGCLVIAAVARIMTPGCKVDYMPIMESPQGDGKSDFCKALGGDYYGSISFDISSVETKRLIRRNWIIENAELSGQTRSDLDQIKKFITDREDEYRVPYDKYPISVKRHCVFIGTHNPTGQGYFIDPTGNRRYWPIEVRYFPKLADGKTHTLVETRDQIFAEAYQRFCAGEDWYIKDKTIQKEVLAMQQSRFKAEIWADVIREWLYKEQAVGVEYPNLTSHFIATDVLNLSTRNIDGRIGQRIANAMRELGWASGYVEGRKGTVRGYINPDFLDIDLILDGL